MAGIDVSGVSFNSTQSLFNSIDTGVAGLAGEYASLQNGSYAKMLKSYYAQEAETTATLPDAQRVNLSDVKSDADALKKSLEKLTGGELFTLQTTQKTDEKGETIDVTDADRAAIATEVGNFVKSYNALLDTLGQAEDKGVLQQAVWLVNTTRSMSGLLEKAGISLGSDNRLSLNEEKLGNTAVSTLTTLFEGRNSFGGKMLLKADNLLTQSARSLSGGKTTYGKSGNVSDILSDGLLYDNTK